MKIYFAHSTRIDYKNEFYKPIKESTLSRTNALIFPHKNNDFINTKDIIADSDLIVAEASYPSTGMGIELGWANSAGKTIVAVYRRGTQPPQSLEVITKNFIEYEPDNLGKRLEEFMTTFHKS